MDQATEFFGKDFSASRTPEQPAASKEPAKGVVQSAKEFFGMDFGSPPPPVKETVLPKRFPNQFEEVFAKLTRQESGDKHTDATGKLTTSPKGAAGITQVMPATGSNPGYGIKPLQNKSKDEYLRFGRDYLKAMLTEFGGDYEKALAAYNAGAGNVKNAVAEGGAKWKDHLPMKEETIPYINNILGKKKTSEGVIEKGNIDLQNRPVVKNKDGSISTVRSIGINIDGQEVLIPTVSPEGKILSDKEAINLYVKTGKHLGKFSSVAASNAYAEKLHKDQEKLYSKGK